MENQVSNSNSQVSNNNEVVIQLQQRMIQFEQQFSLQQQQFAQQLQQAHQQYTQQIQQQQQQIVNLQLQLTSDPSLHTVNLSSPGNSPNTASTSNNTNVTPTATQNAVSTVLTSVRVDVTKPTVWFGHGKQDRSSPSMWMLEVENYFEAVNLSEGPATGKQRLTLVSTLLKHNALQWWNRIDRTTISTWQQFKSAFLAEYEPKEMSEIARSRLDTLRQRGSVVEYCNEFREQINKISDMSTADQLHNFKKGLQPDIAREVAMQRPETLDKAMHLAQRVDLEYQQAHRNYGRFSSNSSSSRHSNHAGRKQFKQFYNSNSGTNNHHASNNSNNFGTAPMELGNTQAKVFRAEHHYNNSGTSEGEQYYSNSDEESDNNNSYNHELHYTNNHKNKPHGHGSSSNHRVDNISPEEVRRRIAAGLCVRCKQKGHFARECPYNNKSNSSHMSKKQ